jgi:hypothetical protein
MKHENDAHNDIVMVDVREDYHELAKKTLAWIQWAADTLEQHISSFDMILKTDHDAYVRVQPLLREICEMIHNSSGASGVDPYHLAKLAERYGHRFTIEQSLQYATTHGTNIARNGIGMNDRVAHKLLYWGHMHMNADVERNVHHRNFDVFAAKQFPPFASGSGYIISADIIQALGNRQLPLKVQINQSTRRLVAFFD